MGKKETKIIVEEEFKTKNEEDRKRELNRILIELIKKTQ